MAGVGQHRGSLVTTLGAIRGTVGEDESFADVPSAAGVHALQRRSRLPDSSSFLHVAQDTKRSSGVRAAEFLTGPRGDGTAIVDTACSPASSSSSSSFLSVHAEQPCPTVDLSKAWMMNSRLGSKCGAKQDKTCCHSIKRSKDAADRIQKMLDQNWWIVHCSAAPLDIEPLVAMLVRWWRKPDNSSSDNASDMEPSETGFCEETPLDRSAT